MAWLAVNRDGRELICKNRPRRKSYKENPGSLSDYDYWSDEDVFALGFCEVEYSIELQKGTIMELIDKELTWDDNPFEFVP